MKELIRTNDPITLSYATALLASEGIETVVFDKHSSFLEGVIPAIQQRLMVIDEDYLASRKIISSDSQLSKFLMVEEGGFWS